MDVVYIYHYSLLGKVDRWKIKIDYIIKKK